MTIATSTWKTLAAGGAQHATTTYASSHDATIGHHYVIFGWTPPPVAAKPGDYIHGQLDIDGHTAFSSWYRITAEHQLEPIDIDQLVAALTTQLLGDITTQTSN